MTVKYPKMTLGMSQLRIYECVLDWNEKSKNQFRSKTSLTWDNKLKRHPNHIFVLCGSVSSWVADNIVNSTAYFGRISRDIVVDESILSLMNKEGDIGKTVRGTDVLRGTCGVDANCKRRDSFSQS